jgi:hypothetical protein
MKQGMNNVIVTHKPDAGLPEYGGMRAAKQVRPFAGG